jgi:uncharacterized protein (TIGR02271 family)
MINETDTNQLMGADVYGVDDSKIGTAGQVYLDDDTGQPEWLSVNTGLFGLKESFVPLSEATFTGGRVQVPYDKDRIKGAPKIDRDGDLSPSEEDELYRYYGIGSSAGRVTGGNYQTGTAGYDTDRDTVGHDTSGPTTDNAMTRSEERLQVGTERQQVGKARLRKYVVTEQQQTTVPVSREEVRIEREPITDANIGQAMDGPAISEEEHEVTLHADRAVVDKETVPVERVRMDTQTVTEEQTVGGEVRKEQIELDDETNRRGRGR